MKILAEKEKDLLKPIFWDIDIDKLDVMKFKRYTIERIMQYGIIEHVSWMLKNFENEDIKETIRTSRLIDERTANFWTIYYNVNRNEILCFTNQSVRSNSNF